MYADLIFLDSERNDITNLTDSRFYKPKMGGKLGKTNSQHALFLALDVIRNTEEQIVRMEKPVSRDLHLLLGAGWANWTPANVTKDFPNASKALGPSMGFLK